MQRYELTIIGGGIAGLGVAAACAERGIPALILEAKEICRATSDNTLRIIHGGFRYLQQCNLPRVLRSLNDQSAAQRSYPTATSPLPCLMPLAAHGLKSRIPVTVAAHLYGTLMRMSGSPLPVPSVLSHRELINLAPDLATHTHHGALCWHDLLMTDPALIASQLATQLTNCGITIREHTPVEAIVEIPAGFEVVTKSGERFESRRIVNTLGPWLHSITLPAGLRGREPKWCLGCNVVVSRQLHPTHALGIQSPDGRLFFCVPREGSTAIGTWYTPSEAPHHDVVGKPLRVPESEIARFIESFRAAYPSAQITLSDIVSVDAGILPMKSLSPAGPVLFGAESLHYNSRRTYCEVLSTKYTTFRSQGERVVGGVWGR